MPIIVVTTEDGEDLLINTAHITTVATLVPHRAGSWNNPTVSVQIHGSTGWKVRGTVADFAERIAQAGRT